MRSFGKIGFLALWIAAAATGIACARNLLRVQVPARAANTPSIHAVDLWIDQAPFRDADGGALVADGGEPIETTISVVLKDHTGNAPTELLPTGSDLTVGYGDPTVTALFASGASVVLVPPTDIPPSAANSAVLRNRYRLRLTLPTAGRNPTTCEITSPAFPHNWEITLRSTIPGRLCIVSMAPAMQPCAGDLQVLSDGGLATVTVMQLENSGSTMPTIHNVSQCADVMSSNPLP